MPEQSASNLASTLERVGTLKTVVIPVTDSELERIKALPFPVMSGEMESALQAIIGEQRWQAAFKGESANQVEIKFVALREG